MKNNILHGEHDNPRVSTKELPPGQPEPANYYALLACILSKGKDRLTVDDVIRLFRL